MSTDTENHLSEQKLRDLVRLRWTDEEITATLAHLLHCQKCRVALLRYEPLKGPSVLETAFGGQVTPALLDDQSMRRAQEIALLHARKCHREDRQAIQLLQRLIATSPGQRPLLVMNRREFQSLGLVRRLLTETRGLWRQDAQAALELAQLAALVAERVLLEDVYPADLVNESRALARAFSANSLRALRRFQEADRELKVAWEWLEDIEKPGDVERAWLLRIQSALMTDVQRFEEARRAAREARRAFFRAGQRRDGLWMTVAEAIILAEATHHAEALSLLERSEKQLTAEGLGDPGYWAALHLRACLLAWSGRSFEARDLLPQIRELEAILGEWHFAARLEWLEALVCQGLGQAEGALAHFRRARDASLDRGLWADAALVMLEMAELALRDGRTREARQVALEASPVLAAHGIDREALVALQVFVQAAKRDAATLEVVAKAQQRVKTARLRPASDS